MKLPYFYSNEEEDIMRAIHTIMSGLLASALVFQLLGCAGTPMTTRTGAVHDIKIEDGLMPAELTVNVGDEIRWVNHRTLPVRVDLVGDAIDNVSCERGFSNFIGMKQDLATIQPSGSVSLCFSKTEIVKYNVRMDSALPGGRNIVQGVVRVGKGSE